VLLRAARKPAGDRKALRFTAEDWEAALRPLSRAPRQLQIAQLLLKSEKALSHKEIQKAVAGADVRDALKRLVEDGTLAEEDELLDPTMKPRRVQAVRLSRESLLMESPWQDIEKAAPKQADALRKLFDIHASSDSASTRDGNATTVQVMETRRLPRSNTATGARVECRSGRSAWPGEERLCRIYHCGAKSRADAALPPRDTHRVQLTIEQQHAVTVINDALHSVRDAEKKNPSVVLLQGVTASGKTEVYLHSIEQCLALGATSCGSGAGNRSHSANGRDFSASLSGARGHSALGSGRWRALRRVAPRTRRTCRHHCGSAQRRLSRPCRDIGLIIIDEEQDHSYKQDAAPRYHARDVALKRASLEGAVVVLGSATPSLESYHRATRGDYAMSA
jgi:primosomal protein N' (replication factor Y)